MENTMEKIYEEIEEIQESNDSLFHILEAVGHDSETIYTQAYLGMLKDVKTLRDGIQAVLDNHHNTIMDVECEV